MSISFVKELSKVGLMIVAILFALLAVFPILMELILKVEAYWIEVFHK